MKEYGIPARLPNVAQIIPPETRSGQRALNGDLHIVDKVILPDPFAFCRAGDFEFVQGYAFQSQIVSQVDEAGLVIDNIVPREAYQFCEKLPCSYTVPGLYGRAGFYLSVEVVIQYKSVMPLCDPWCSPTSFWWCIPCTGIYAQTVLTIGGCAPYQNWHHCGGALSIWSPTQARFGGVFKLLSRVSHCSPFTGGGMRVVDISVPAKGFKLHNGQTAKILATYDGLCNCTKVYINDKLRGIADPFDVGQHAFQPFADVADNFFDSITIGHSIHSRNITPTADFFPNAGDISAGTGGRGRIDTDTAETEAAICTCHRIISRRIGASQQRGSLRRIRRTQYSSEETRRKFIFPGRATS